MAGSDSTFVLVATYPDRAMAQYDYQMVKEAHRAGLVGSYDAAIITKDANGKEEKKEKPKPGVQNRSSGAAYSIPSATIQSHSRASPSAKPPRIQNAAEPHSQTRMRMAL